MKPTEPGFYYAEEVVYDLLLKRIQTRREIVRVVADVPNPRGHKLLVATGHNMPRYRSLDCYDFGKSVEKADAA